jgi:hypothetical protein
MPGTNSKHLKYRPTFGWILTVIGGVAMMVLALPCLFTPLGDLRDIAVTDAEVFHDYQVFHSTPEYHYTSDSGDDPSYGVTYAYSVDGVRYTGSSLTRDIPSSTMPVEYLKSRPAVSGMALRDEAWKKLEVFGCTVLCLMLGLVLLLGHHGLSRRGRPVPSVVPRNRR